jgi:hypothetical protein
LHLKSGEDNRDDEKVIEEEEKERNEICTLTVRHFSPFLSCLNMLALGSLYGSPIVIYLLFSTRFLLMSFVEYILLEVTRREVRVECDEFQRRTDETDSNETDRLQFGVSLQDMT